MRGERCALRAGEYLVWLACRRLPARIGLRWSRAAQNWYWTATRWAAIGWMNLAMMSRCSG